MSLLQGNVPFMLCRIIDLCKSLTEFIWRMRMNDRIKVGRYNLEFNKILDIDYEELDIYSSDGLIKHMKKRNHKNCLKYIENIPDIINNPDYIGINPKETERSVELIKQYEDNVMLGIKLDADEKYYYVSTMFEIQESKIERRLHSDRIKKFSVDTSEKK